MQIEVKVPSKNYNFETVISGNEQPQIEVNFDTNKPTIEIEIDLNYNVTTNNITQNITNITNNFSLLTFTYQDIC